MRHCFVNERAVAVLDGEVGLLLVTEKYSTFTNRYGTTFNLPFSEKEGGFIAGRYLLRYDPKGEAVLAVAKWNPSTRTRRIVCEGYRNGERGIEVRGEEGQLWQLLEVLFCLSIPKGGYIPDPEYEDPERDYLLFACYDL